MTAEIDSPVLARVRELVSPIVDDLGLDLYDLEHRGGALRITLDTPTGSADGITLDTLALASRLMSKELDQHDPIPARYELEVTSPGVERTLRTADHFRRAVGQEIAVRLSDVEAAERRIQGMVVDAGDDSVTVRTAADDRVIRYRQIDRARTVFRWGGQPKPGKGKKQAKDTVVHQ